MSWRSIGRRSSELGAGGLLGVQIDAREIVLVRTPDSVIALDGACPHAGGSLAEGTLEGGQITCPLHHAAFRVEDGSIAADPFGIVPPSGDVPGLTRYPVRVQDGELWVDLPE